MKSKKLGKSTSKAEVLSISPYGIWLIALGREYFLPYSKFPWFKNAPVNEVFEISLIQKNHLRWESLDIDLEINSLSQLEQYPLIAN